MCALFLLVHPLCGSVGYVPTLVISAICVYIGADFLWDNLVEPLTAAIGASGSGSEGKGLTLSGLVRSLFSVAGTWAVLIFCVKRDMLMGTVLGILGFQVAAYWKRRQAKGD